MIDEKFLNHIRDIIKNQTGITINDDRLIDFEIVVRGRIISNKKTEEDYAVFLQNSDSEIITLASFFTIQETSFYRNKSHFDKLKEKILPELILKRKNQKKKQLFILSAGCATGEEPYTVAMLIKSLPVPYNIDDTWDIRIIATDIHEKALNNAREGIYSEYKLRNLDPFYKEKYFEKTKNRNNFTYKLKNSIKNMVTFLQCNLIKEPFQLAHLNNMDIIFCENVIIYFTMESTQRLINNFYKILDDNGYLFLGFSETLSMIQHNFRLCWWQSSFAYQKILDVPPNEKNNTNKAEIMEKNLKLSVNLYISPNSYKDYIFLAVQYYRQGLIENVSNILEEIEKSSIQAKEDFYTIKAELLLDKKDYLNSANSCRNAIINNPYYIYAHLLLCDIYLELNMLDKVDFEIKTSLYIDKSSILAYYFLIKYYKKTDDNANYKNSIKNLIFLLNSSSLIFSNNIYPLNETKRKKIYDDIMEFKNLI